MYKKLLESKKYRKIHKMICDRKFGTFNIEGLDNKRHQTEIYDLFKYKFQCVAGADKLCRRQQQDLILKKYRHFDVISLMTPMNRIHTQIIIQTRDWEDDL